MKLWIKRSLRFELWWYANFYCKNCLNLPLLEPKSKLVRSGLNQYESQNKFRSQFTNHSFCILFCTLYFSLSSTFFQVVVFILTVQCAFGLPDPGKAGKQCTLIRSPTDTGKNLRISGLLLNLHMGVFSQFLGQILTNKRAGLIIIFRIFFPPALTTIFYVIHKIFHPLFI